MALKHIGRMKRTSRKVAVAYRTLPGDADHCVVVTTESLDAAEHDTLMKVLEGNDAQYTVDEFAEAMGRALLPDGRNMLAAFHTTGKMIRVPTAEVEMTPDTKTVVSLDELNRIIAQNKGVSVEDLAIKDNTRKRSTAAPVQEETIAEVQDLEETFSAPEDSVLTDEQLAAKYRSDADRMYKEAKRLREMAEELVPTKKKKIEESA